ncbi:hypothetical protein ACE6H2_016278 [Prunus campanulata]
MHLQPLGSLPQGSPRFSLIVMPFSPPLRLLLSLLLLALQNLLPMCRMMNEIGFPRSKALKLQIATPFASLSPPFQLLLLIFSSKVFTHCLLVPLQMMKPCPHKDAKCFRKYLIY